MIGGISIDYRPSQQAVPAILALVEDAGFTLRGLKTQACTSGEHATLCLDLDGYRSRVELEALAHRIVASGAALAVTHLANAQERERG